MDVAITGVAGLIGAPLAAALAADETVGRVLGIDAALPGTPVEQLRGVELHTGDVRDPGLGDLLDDVDVLVHLAFVLDPAGDPQRMRQVNVEGTRTVLQAAVRAGVRRLVVASSASVYGAHADNDVPLTEASPRRAGPGLPYAWHKAEVEEWLWEWAAHLDGVTVTVLRPALVGAPHADNFATAAFALPVLPAIGDRTAIAQVVHLDDVVAAFHLVATADHPGAFNVAPPGWLTYQEVAAALGRPLVRVGRDAASSALGAAWRLGVAPTPPGVLEYLRHPWVVDASRLRAAGWTPRHSNRDALAALREPRTVRVGSARLRRGAVVTLAGLALLGAAGAAAATVGRRG